MSRRSPLSGNQQTSSGGRLISSSFKRMIFVTRPGHNFCFSSYLTVTFISTGNTIVRKGQWKYEAVTLFHSEAVDTVHLQRVRRRHGKRSSSSAPMGADSRRTSTKASHY